MKPNVRDWHQEERCLSGVDAIAESLAGPLDWLVVKKSPDRDCCDRRC
ncbi:MAG: hypothetical protein AAGM36_00750 [Cyanobacteria bacterium J06597_1]